MTIPLPLWLSVRVSVESTVEVVNDQIGDALLLEALFATIFQKYCVVPASEAGV